MKQKPAFWISIACAGILSGSPVRAAAETDGPVYDSFLNLLPIGKLVDELSLDELADMVVTESKVAQSRQHITQKIDILHVEDMEQETRYNRNLAELLRYSSGQFVNVLSRNDANWGSYAGLGPKYNSYLLDGLPIDSFADAMSLDPWAFERVEAHKGPASVLYSNYLSMDFAGNLAPLAGTTNFIVRDQVDVPLTRALVGVGTWDTYNGRLYHQGRYQDTSYLFGGNVETSNYTQFGLDDSWLEATKDPVYDKRKVYGKVSQALGRADHRLSLFAHSTRHRGDGGRPNRDFQHDYDTLNLAYNNQLSERLHVQIKAGLRDYLRQYNNDNYPVDLATAGQDETRQRIVPVDATLNVAHGDNHLLTLGADSQWVRYRTTLTNAEGVSEPDNDVTARSTGVFVQEKLQLKRWVLRAGLRYNSIKHDYALLGGLQPEMDHVSWDKTLWSLGARFNFSERLSFYANSGTSFMAPAAKQVGGTIPPPDEAETPYPGQVPNPGLSPESGWGNDVGIDWWPNERLTLGARLFYNRIENAIVDNVVSNTPSRIISVNAGRATATGIELDIEHLLSERWQWFANVTFTETTIDNPEEPDQNGTAIPFAPDLMANLGITASLPWQSSAAARYSWIGRYYDSSSRSSRMEYGQYGVLCLRLQKSLYRDAERALSLSLDLNNLLDERYEMPFSFEDPGFNAFVALNLIF
jgi:outer membrane receptor protein involved in Fe transport